MPIEDEFEPMDENAPHLGKKHVRIKSGVIKSHRKNIEGRIQLSPPSEDDDHGVEFFQPIYEGETIIGVMHKCVCGRTSEIRFQYMDE